MIDVGWRFGGNCFIFHIAFKKGLATSHETLLPWTKLHGVIPTKLYSVNKWVECCLIFDTNVNSELKLHCLTYIYRHMDRDSSVGTATCYGLDGLGIESRWGRDFPHPSRPFLEPTQAPIKCVPGLYPRLRRSGRGVNHPPQSSTEVKEKIELYFYSPSGPSWTVLGRSLPLPLVFPFNPIQIIIYNLH